MTRHVASRAAISRYSRFAPKCSPHFASNALAPGEDLPKRSGSCSSATMNGVPVPVVSRLLGHSNVSMTLRYAHLGDRDIEAATERVGQAIATIIGLEND